jgi:hypothetical protein
MGKQKLKIINSVFFGQGFWGGIFLDYCLRKIGKFSEILEWILG